MTSESSRIVSLPWLIAAIAIVGVLISGAAALGVRRDKLALIENEFVQRAGERSMAIELELTMIVDHVESLAALYQAYEEIDRRHFSSFAGAMIEDHPDIQALGIDPVVLRAQRRAHEVLTITRKRRFLDPRRDRMAEGAVAVRSDVDVRVAGDSAA